MANELIHFNKARNELELARTIDEAKDISNKAEALKVYAKQSGESLEMQNNCAEIRLRADRRIGEFSKKLPVARGKSKMTSHGGESFKTDTLKEAGIKHHERYEALADIPEEQFEQEIKNIKESGKELTNVTLQRVSQRIQKKETQENKLANTPEGKFRTIVIDPPWEMKKILREERPKQDVFDYKTMTIEEITAFPISAIADDDGCHVYLWTTQRYLPHSFEIFKEWGVRYECLLTWVKNVGFTPFSFMYSTEHILFGRIGKLDLLKMGKRLDFQAKVQGHSVKPDIFYDLVAEVSPAPRIDVFARKQRDGFKSYGNEINI